VVCFFCLILSLCLAATGRGIGVGRWRIAAVVVVTFHQILVDYRIVCFVPFLAFRVNRFVQVSSFLLSLLTDEEFALLVDRVGDGFGDVIEA
jgi:predicted branched-subunit amino acid permease